MLTYQCINCMVTWDVEEGNCDDGFLSHGLCLDCLRLALTPLYRRHQLRDGHFDCFGKSGTFCDQENCKYKEICLRENK